jgi:hypothetical protein
VTGHVVVLNGEIYNFGDLRRRLLANGQEAVYVFIRWCHRNRVFR